MAAQRWSQSMTPRTRSTSQMPIELASIATSSRASDVPTAVRAAASSSSAITEAASCSSSCASSADHPRGKGSYTASTPTTWPESATSGAPR